MSWVKRISCGEQDVFDEYADDTSLLSREWASNMKKRIKVKLLMFEGKAHSFFTATVHMDVSWYMKVA